ncbi:MAG: thrombospondin type 3 repeat-containing protein, partial [Myxococcales bacterium]|nr:thrombospondin type 3 repeat-containing protein [Myxococcales bacterium]
GDVCDNCVAIANCEDHDAMNPATENDLPEYPGAADPCQTPWEGHAMIGDACVSEGAPVQLPGAAGPVGFGPDDDWDQDGLRNTIDYCPRQPKPLELCVDEEDCPEDSTCSDGVCNHLDPDGDLVGTICDTCPFVANPEQRAEGGAELDDPDGDFIGSVCELDASCSERPNPRPVAHYPISVGGYCCVATWYEKAGPLEPNGVHDPNGVELLPDCAGYGEGDCRELPPSVVATPGVVEVPPGCEQALADSDLPISQRVFMDVSHPLVNGDVDVWRSYECLLPPLDQDFDGVADACDLCPFAFDPANQPYVDGGGELWPDLGKYCNGEYHPKFACEP